MNKRYAALLFVLALLIVSIFYNYQEIAFKRPQSIHKWRQADCASIALNYYQGGMDFAHSETHNLTSDNGTNGKCCTSEVPGLYFVVAFLYRIFGYHDFIYRIFNTLLFFLGLFFLFRLFHLQLKDAFWAISLTLLFFTSPVLVYYGNNFLPNSSAFAFSLVGWYYFVRFVSEYKTRWFYISVAFFLVAASLKVTALFSLFAITGICLLEVSKLVTFQSKRKLFGQPARQLRTIALVFVLIGLWLMHAHHYNQKHDCSYFSTNLFPIWNLSKDEIKGVLENIRQLWLPEYFHTSVLLFLAVCMVFILAFFRKNNKVLIYSILFVFAEVVVYVLLQFWTFADHDYYTIDMYILPVLIVISTFDLLQRHFNLFFKSVILKIAFSLFLLYNIYSAHQKINNRYDSWMNDYPQNKDFYTVTPYLRQIGLTPEDTVISIPDITNVSLYLMNQKGWTEYTDAKLNKSAAVHYNKDSAGIQASINKGAKYLVLNNITELYKKPYLKPFCTHLTGKYRNILIFNLKNRTRNFTPEVRIISQFVTCNAEILSRDKQNYNGQPESALFQNGETRSNEYSHSGNYSVKLNPASPVGMTISFKDLQQGESFRISVWRKVKGNSASGIVASSAPTPYYNSNGKIVETSANGWEKIVLDFFIPSELSGQELTVYVHNADSTPVYFDDLEITRFKSLPDL